MICCVFILKLWCVHLKIATVKIYQLLNNMDFSLPDAARSTNEFMLSLYFGFTSEDNGD